MSGSHLSVEPAVVPSDARLFHRLQRAGPEPSSQVGCLLMLSMPLLALGLGAIWLYSIDPAGQGDMWVMPVVGGAFALVGALLLYGGLRGLRGVRVARTEVALDRDPALAPGDRLRLRVRQPGPVGLESLKVKLLCQRFYMRQVSKRSAGKVEDREVLGEGVLLELKNERVARGHVLERDVEFTIPEGAPPTGRAMPEGDIRWSIEVSGETGFLSAIHHPFDITVKGRGAGAARDDHEAPAVEPSMPAAAPEPDSTSLQGRLARATWPQQYGCLGMALGFTVVGVFLLWMFFRHAEGGRGNPMVGLVGGVIFTALGLVGLAAEIKSRRGP